MKTFNVLPTNEEFRKLSDNQLELILYSLQEDHREAQLARKGLTVDSESYDTTFEDEVWNRDVGDWDILREGHDPDDIARQVEELTKAEDLKNLASKFDSLDDYNAHLEAGGKTTRETEVEQYINKQIEAAQEKARLLSAGGATEKKLVDDRTLAQEQDTNDHLPDIDKAAIDKSIALFNATEDDDDEFVEL